MKILLTGATGYIGASVASALQRAGHRVVGLVRTPDDAVIVSGKGISPIIGGLDSYQLLVDQAEAADGVIHAALQPDERGPMLDAAAISTLIGALANSGKPLVYTSGVWILGDTGGDVADEATPLNPIPPVRWRSKVEQLVRDAAKFGIRSVVIRPAIVYGRRGGIVERILRNAHRMGAAACVGPGHNRWPFVHIDDLSDLYKRAVESAAPGSTFYGSAGESISFRQFAEAASHAAGCSGKVVSVTDDDVRPEWGEYAVALELDQRVSSARAQSMLGWIPTGPSVLDFLLDNSNNPRENRTKQQERAENVTHRKTDDAPSSEEQWQARRTR